MSEASPVAVDLFCGAGGLSLGLQLAGFEVGLGVDHDTHATTTYAQNLDSKVQTADIRSLDIDSLDIDTTAVDIVAGGPPCPTFSNVGRSKIRSIGAQNPQTDTRHQLYEHFLRFVEGIDPLVVLMENVPGMKSAVNAENQSVIEVIRKDMEELGYSVSVQFPDAADFGVPQRRVRTIFIGNRLEQSNPDLDKWVSHRAPRNEEERDLRFINGESPSQQGRLDSFGVSSNHRKSSGQSFPAYQKNTPYKGPWITVGEAILDLPPLSPNGETPPTSCSEYFFDPFTDYQIWSRANTDRNSLENHQARGHNMDDLSIYKLLGEGVGWIIGDVDGRFQPYRDDIFPDNYRKQKATRPASTILAHISKDGHQYIHPREARSLTVREAARLQSFPDDFVFPVSRTQAYQQVGNAVPPLLGHAIGRAIIDELL